MDGGQEPHQVTIFTRSAPPISHDWCSPGGCGCLWWIRAYQGVKTQKPRCLMLSWHISWLPALARLVSFVVDCYPRAGGPLCRYAPRQGGSSAVEFFTDQRYTWCQYVSMPIGSYRIHVWYIYIYGNIGGILMVNVTIYTIHGSYGICVNMCQLCQLVSGIPCIPLHSGISHYGANLGSQQRCCLQKIPQWLA